MWIKTSKSWVTKCEIKICMKDAYREKNEFQKKWRGKGRWFFTRRMYTCISINKDCKEKSFEFVFHVCSENLGRLFRKYVDKGLSVASARSDKARHSRCGWACSYPGGCRKERAWGRGTEVQGTLVTPSGDGCLAQIQSLSLQKSEGRTRSWEHRSYPAGGLIATEQNAVSFCRHLSQIQKQDRGECAR
jgi:hypothetical protein